MKHEVPFRIIVTEPLSGVEMMVQNGKDKLLGPALVTSAAKTFEFSITVDTGSEVPNFLGPFAQGPKDARFIYVNSGTYAGQTVTCWSRRAKLSLMSISREQVETVLALRGARLETAINGVGRDGGPVCASVKGIEWRIAEK
jgi:hypothetical protein